jgi:cytosine/uracil/thiamine/allantoin permease
MSSIAKKLGWTGWLLVLVNFGALTAISHYIAQWVLLSHGLSFYEVFVTVILSGLVLYVLAQVYDALRNKSSTSKWWP